MKPDAQLVKTFLLQLQDDICQQLERVDGSAFIEDYTELKSVMIRY